LYTEGLQIKPGNAYWTLGVKPKDVTYGLEASGGDCGFNAVVCVLRKRERAAVSTFSS
jgi:hypothetical protein